MGPLVKERGRGLELLTCGPSQHNPTHPQLIYREEEGKQSRALAAGSSGGVGGWGREAAGEWGKRGPTRAVALLEVAAPAERHQGDGGSGGGGARRRRRGLGPSAAPAKRRRNSGSRARMGGASRWGSRTGGRGGLRRPEAARRRRPGTEGEGATVAAHLGDGEGEGRTGATSLGLEAHGDAVAGGGGSPERRGSGEAARPRELRGGDSSAGAYQ